MIIDAEIDGRHVHADPVVIAYDGRSIPLADVEWVRYHTVRTTIRGLFGLGRAHVGSDWHFEVGRYPVNGAPMIAMVLSSVRKAEPEVWASLVRLSRGYLEPRLVAELAERVRSGRTVDVGAGLKVHRHGVDGGGVSLPWAAVSGTTLSDGRIWIYESGSARAVISIPQQNPNAVLIPALFDAVRS